MILSKVESSLGRATAGVAVIAAICLFTLIKSPNTPGPNIVLSTAHADNISIHARRTDTSITPPTVAFDLEKYMRDVRRIEAEREPAPDG